MEHGYRKFLHNITVCVSLMCGVHAMEQEVTKEQRMVTIEIGRKQYQIPKACLKNSSMLQDSTSFQQDTTIPLEENYVPARLWETIIQDALVTGAAQDWVLKLCAPKDLIGLIKATDFLGIEYLRTAALGHVKIRIQENIALYATDETVRSVWNGLDEDSLDELATTLNEKHPSWTNIQLPPSTSWLSRIFTSRHPLVVVCSLDGAAVFFGLSDGTILKKEGASITEFGEDNGAILGMVEVPGRAVLVSCSADKWFKLRNIKTGTMLVECRHDDTVTSVACNAKGTLLVSGSIDGSIKVWDVPTRIAGIRMVSAGEADGKILKVQFINNDTEILSTVLGGGITSWKVVDQQKLHKVGSVQFNDTVSAVLPLPNSYLVYLGTSFGNVWLIDRALKTETVWFTIEANRCCSFALSSDNTMLACAFNDTVKLYKMDYSEGTPAIRVVETFTHKGSTISSIAFSHDNKELISCSDQGVNVCNLNGIRYTLEQAIFVYASLQQKNINKNHPLYQLLNEEQKTSLRERLESN